jgi:hypothetical protein
MPQFWKAALVGAALIIPIAFTTSVLRADDHNDGRKYHDKKHKDDHEWNNHEDQAYRIWVRDNHRKDSEFGTLKLREQQSYWNWRHSHSDVLLKIEIH